MVDLPVVFLFAAADGGPLVTMTLSLCLFPPSASLLTPLEIFVTASSVNLPVSVRTCMQIHTTTCKYIHAIVARIFVPIFCVRIGKYSRIFVYGRILVRIWIHINVSISHVS